MTFGMPFEVWKTHMGTYRSEGTMQAFRNIYNKGGVLSFWSGWQPKLFESFMKGASCRNWSSTPCQLCLVLSYLPLPCLVLSCIVNPRFLHNWIVLPCTVLFCSQPSLRYEKRCTAIHLLSITRWWGDCGVCDNCSSNIYAIQNYSTVDLQNCDKLTCTIRSAVNTQHTDRTVQVNLSKFCRSTVLCKPSLFDTDWAKLSDISC